MAKKPPETDTKATQETQEHSPETLLQAEIIHCHSLIEKMTDRVSELEIAMVKHFGRVG